MIHSNKSRINLSHELICPLSSANSLPLLLSRVSLKHEFVTFNPSNHLQSNPVHSVVTHYSASCWILATHSILFLRYTRRRYVDTTACAKIRKTSSLRAAKAAVRLLASFSMGKSHAWRPRVTSVTRVHTRSKDYHHIPMCRGDLD